MFKPEEKVTDIIVRQEIRIEAIERLLRQLLLGTMFYLYIFPKVKFSKIKLLKAFEKLKESSKSI